MDCKLENAARSMVRIECLLLQGFLYGVWRAVCAVLFMPFIPYVYLVSRFLGFAPTGRWLVRIVLIPYWIVVGIMVAVVSPFKQFWKVIADMWYVTRSEWVNRWRASTPKKPNGKPLYIMDDYERTMLDYAVIESVIKDYNAEAKFYGQGIPD